MLEEDGLFRLLIQNSGDIIAVVDENGITRFIGGAVERILGFGAEEYVGKSGFDNIHPDDLDEAKRLLREFISEPGARRSMVYRERHRDGRWIHIEAMATNLLSEPLVRGIVLNLRDATERLRMEAELRTSEERTRAITANLPGVVYQFYATDAGEYGCNYVSDRTRNVFGLIEEPGGFFEKFTACVHEDDRERFLSSIRDVVAARAQWSFEGRFVKPSGERIWFHGISTPRRVDDRLIFDGILLDITERKRAEEAVEKRIVALTRPLEDASAVTFEELFNLDDLQRLQDEFALATGVASIITHTDGTPITKPSNFCRLCRDVIRGTELGRKNCYASDAELGKLSTKGPAVQPCLSGGLWDAGAGISVGGRHVANWLIGQVRDETQTEEKMREYARRIGADEEVVAAAFGDVTAMSRERFENVAQVLFTLANQLSASAYQNVQQARFITERNRAEEESKRLEQQLFQSQKMEAVGRLAGGVAHDFNNLLTAIEGSISLVQLELAPQDPLSKLLSDAAKAAESAGDLTKQLLAFSRRQMAVPKVLDLNEVVQRSHRMLRRLIGEDVDLRFIPGELRGRVRIDPGQVEQILVNLAVNARDAMPNGGSLSIETSNTFLDEGYCARHPGSQVGLHIALIVSDTGVGMTPEILSCIFEPFFTTKERGKGTGLGLSTVFGVVKQNGGSIDVYSEVGIGSTFKVYLPLVSEEAEPITRPTPDAMPRGTERVYVVEDEEIVRSIAEHTLSILGYEVSAFPNGGEALVALEGAARPPKILVTDVILPGMNGKVLAEKALALRPSLRVLYTSGYTEDTIAHHGLMKAGIEFIAKPYTPFDLAAKVRAVLDK